MKKIFEVVSNFDEQEVVSDEPLKDCFCKI